MKDKVKRYPTIDLIRRLFPNVKMRGRNSLCNPVREDRHPSMVLYTDSRYGYPKWKDYATGEFGDNIDFFMKVFPEYAYDEAVDKMSWMLFGMSAYQDPSSRDISLPRRKTLPASERIHIPVEEPDPVLKVVDDQVLSVETASPGMVAYWRGRGISDEVIYSRCRRVVFENTNRSGSVLFDRKSGMPVVDSDGSLILDEARTEAIGLANDIGFYALRIPDTSVQQGYKVSQRQFISTIYADGSLPRGRVSFVGEGNGLVQFFRYDPATKFLQVNPTQGFAGVEPSAERFVLPFLDNWMGRHLEGKELRGAVAVVDSLNGPVNTVVTVVEGLFDELSVEELNRMSGGWGPGTDIVVLNSVSNLFWAIPFLSMHREVRSLLDNDMRSGTGQKAYALLEQNVASYCQRCGGICSVRSDSGLIYPHKDVNDYLMARKRLPVKVPVVSDAPAKPDEKKITVVTPPVVKAVPRRRRRMGPGY